MSPLVGELGKNTSITPAFVSKKYPLPAVVFKVVEPSATVTACQSMCLTVPEPPNDTLDPFNVIELFANSAFDISPLANVTDLLDKSNVEANFVAGTVPGAISAAKTVPSSILSVVTASSAIPVFVTFVRA